MSTDSAPAVGTDMARAHDIYAMEREKVFARSWVYPAHESETSTGRPPARTSSATTTTR